MILLERLGEGTQSFPNTIFDNPRTQGNLIYYPKVLSTASVMPWAPKQIISPFSMSGWGCGCGGLGAYLFCLPFSFQSLHLSLCPPLSIWFVPSSMPGHAKCVEQIDQTQAANSGLRSTSATSVLQKKILLVSNSVRDATQN